MTEEKEDTNEKKTPVLCELLIEVGTKYAVENKMSIPELVGHFSIANREIYTRQLAAVRNQLSAPSEGGDMQEQEASSQA